MFGVGLQNPKNPINVGQVLRAAHAFGASMVAITSKRIRSATNVSSAEYVLPVLRGDDLHKLIPFNCVPVAVELIEGAESIINFSHPLNTFYVFGAEDATLGKKTLCWCKHVIYIPTKICLNLAACVSIVLYDRMMKLKLNEKEK